MSKDNVQLAAAHERSDPDDGLTDVVVGFPDVEVVVVGLEDGVVPFDTVVLASVVLTLVAAGELKARLARNTFIALNSWPRPVFPSYLVFVQSVPQAVPLAPPEHCFAAPSAELCR